MIKPSLSNVTNVFANNKRSNSNKGGRKNENSDMSCELQQHKAGELIVPLSSSSDDILIQRPCSLSRESQATKVGWEEMVSSMPRRRL